MPIYCVPSILLCLQTQRYKITVPPLIEGRMYEVNKGMGSRERNTVIQVCAQREERLCQRCVWIAQSSGVLRWRCHQEAFLEKVAAEPMLSTGVISTAERWQVTIMELLPYARLVVSTLLRLFPLITLWVRYCWHHSCFTHEETNRFDPYYLVWKWLCWSSNAGSLISGAKALTTDFWGGGQKIEWEWGYWSWYEIFCENKF